MNYALRQEAKAQSLIPILCEVTQNYEIHEFRLYLRSSAVNKSRNFILCSLILIYTLPWGIY